MIRKLRRKFVAVVMGASAVILLAVFVVLLVSMQSGMRGQTREALNVALGLEERRYSHERRAEDPAPAEEQAPADGADGAPQAPEDPGLPEGPGLPGGAGEQLQPPESFLGGKRWNGRVPCFTASVARDGSVTVQDRAFFLQDEFDTEQIEELARTAAASSQDSGSLSSYRLLYAKRPDGDGTLVAFADTSAELAATGELVKNSLLVGAATLLVFFGASLLLARWAVKPVETAWMQQKQFVGDASHELKTPLTVILGNADMILSHPEGDQRRWAENIKAESERMKRLTEELLSLARTEDPERVPVREHTDLSYLVTDCVLSFEPAVFESGRELHYEVAEGLSAVGDPAALTQLVGILLENAIKYSTPGGTVAVRLEPSGRWARLSVANTGEPIPPEDLTRIFERFTRGDPSRHGDGGHGLGLSIARSVVEAHKGKIWAESREGLNTFVVLLPGGKP